MKLIIDIPKEFETDYQVNKFKDFFSRVLCDIEKGKCLCGNYEKETAEMFLKAFDESVPMANIVEKLEEEKEKAQDEMEECIFKGLPYHDSTEGKIIGITTAINIVKQEINKEN